MGTTVSQDKFSTFILRTFGIGCSVSLISFVRTVNIKLFGSVFRRISFLCLQLVLLSKCWHLCTVICIVHSADHCASYRIYGCEWKFTHKCTFFFVLLLWMNSNGKRFTFIHFVLEQVSVFIIQLHTDRYFCTTGLHSCIYLQFYVNMCIFFGPYRKSCLIILHSFFLVCDVSELACGYQWFRRIYCHQLQ
jgi:hypothetical protein